MHHFFGKDGIQLSSTVFVVVGWKPTLVMSWLEDEQVSEGKTGTKIHLVCCLSHSGASDDVAGWTCGLKAVDVSSN